MKNSRKKSSTISLKSQGSPNYAMLWRFLWIIPLLLMLPAPMAWAKFLLGCTTIILLHFSTPINKNTVSAWLGILFLFAYILSPYWLMISDYEKIGLINWMPQTAARLCAFIIVVGLGLGWSWLAASEYKKDPPLENKNSHLELAWPLLLAIILLLFNLKSFYNVIPIQTDEHHHISRMLYVRRTIILFLTKTNPLLIFFVLGSMFLASIRPKKIPLVFRILAVPIIALMVCVVYGLTDWIEQLKIVCARYPLVNVWAQQFGLFWESNRQQEAFYRIIPMLGMFAIGYFVLWVLRKNNIHPIISIIAATAFAISPSICFNATILYLEIPAVVLVMISVYYIDELLARDFKSVKTHPAWLALITFGFIKETLFAVIITIVGLRVIVRGWILVKNKQLNLKTIISEAGAVFCIALPLVFYLVCRTQFAEKVRPYHFRFNNLFQIELWKAAGLSTWDQYGPALILAIIGTTMGIYKKRYLWTGAVWLVFAAHFLFHFLGKSGLVGYARFQIFLLGPLAALSLYALVVLAKKRPFLCAIASLVVLAGNLWLCPVDPLSGGKKPGWETRKSPYYSERYYPCRQAIQWLKENHPNTPMIIGSTHPASMGFRWTCDRYQFRPKAQFVKLTENKRSKPGLYRESLEKTLKTAAEYKVPLVMFYKTDDTTVIHNGEKKLYGYTAFKIISNKYQAIVFYRREG